MEKKARNFRDYKVWQDAVNYATQVYSVTTEMPWFEKRGLCDQLQRAAVSIASNIAEGAARPTDADFAHFLDLALGSACEVETQLLIAYNIGYFNQEGSQDKFEQLKNNIFEIECQLGGLIRLIRQS